MHGAEYCLLFLTVFPHRVVWSRSDVFRWVKIKPRLLNILQVQYLWMGPLDGLPMCLCPVVAMFGRSGTAVLSATGERTLLALTSVVGRFNLVTSTVQWFVGAMHGAKGRGSRKPAVTTSIIKRPFWSFKTILWYEIWNKTMLLRKKAVDKAVEKERLYEIVKYKAEINSKMTSQTISQTKKTLNWIHRIITSAESAHVL